MNVTDDMVQRMKDAVEGECDGLAIDDNQAKAILDYVLSAAPSGVEVKALEWEECSDRCWDADGMGKLYRVMKRVDGTAKLKHGVYDGGVEYNTLEAAKAAAQADYEARILSALSTTEGKDNE